MNDNAVDPVVQELQQQLLVLSTRAALWAREVAERDQRIKSLTEQVEKQAEELKSKVEE